MLICAASNNAGKLKELRRILERMGHEVKSLRELGITLDPEETGTTFAENARIKAEAFCKASGLPTVADDSGLCVDALHGAPGVYSARYAGRHGNDAANNAKLLQEMQNVPAENRTARFVSAVCFLLPDGRELLVEGECPGTVALTETGPNGFGYDPPQLCRTGRRRKGRHQPPRPRHGKTGCPAAGFPGAGVTRCRPDAYHNHKEKRYAQQQTARGPARRRQYP